MVDISLTMVMQWINFGVLLFILYHILYKPLVKFLDERSREIDNNLKDAADQSAKAQDLMAQYESKIKAVEKEAEQFMENMKRDALREKHKIMQRAEDEATATLERARKEIVSEFEHARSELKKEVSTIAVRCAQKILEKEVSEQEHAAFITQFLESEFK